MNEFQPMTVRFTPEEDEFLEALAKWWCSQGKIEKPTKAHALRKMLAMVQPPQNEVTHLAKQLRAAHEALLSQRVPE